MKALLRNSKGLQAELTRIKEELSAVNGTSIDWSKTSYKQRSENASSREAAGGHGSSYQLAEAAQIRHTQRLRASLLLELVAGALSVNALFNCSSNAFAASCDLAY